MLVARLLKLPSCRRPFLFFFIFFFSHTLPTSASGGKQSNANTAHALAAAHSTPRPSPVFHCLPSLTLAPQLSLSLVLFVFTGIKIIKLIYIPFDSLVSLDYASCECVCAPAMDFCCSFPSIPYATASKWGSLFGISCHVAKIQ